MDLKSGYPKIFVHEFNKITNKENTEDILKLEGISKENFDIMKYSNNFYSSDNNANASIDDNANLGKHKTSNSFANGAYKPYTKLHSYYLLWDKLKSVYGLETANEAISRTVNGDIYIHDATNMGIPYCFNYTCYDITLKGLPAWSGIADITAPTTMMSYVNQIKNFLVSASSQQMGATGIADFLVFFAWYVQRVLEGVSDENDELVESDYKDVETFEKNVWLHAKRQLRSFIYDLNFKYKGDQSLFTNVSLYDDSFLDSMLKDIKMPGDVTNIDKEIVKDVQLLYCEIYNNVLSKTVITYPVTTACFSTYNEEEIHINNEFEFTQDDKVIRVTGGLFSKEEEILASKIKLDDVIKIDDKEIKVEKLVKNILEENVIRDGNFLEDIANVNIDKQWCNHFYGPTSVMSGCCFVGNEYIEVTEKETGRTIVTTMEKFVNDEIGNAEGVQVEGYFENKFSIQSLNPSTLEYEDVDIVSLLKKTYTGKMYTFVIGDKKIKVTADHILLVKEIGNNVTKEITADMFDKLYHLLPINNNSKSEFASVDDVIVEDHNEYVYDIELSDNHYFAANGIESHNCRLRSNMDDFDESFSSVTGSGSAKIGSIGVVTINMPRVGYKFKTEDAIHREIESLTELTIKINYAKRLMVMENIDRGMLPIYTDGYMDLNRQYSTTGIIGVYEFVDTLGLDILTEEGSNFAINAINLINDIQVKYSKEEMYKGLKFNVEQVPGESASVKLCEKDRLKGYQTDYSIYSNQFIPLKVDATLIDRIRISGKFDQLMSGGSIVHIGLDRRLVSIEKYMELAREIARAGVKTWAVNHTLGKCVACKKVDVYEKDNYICTCGSEHIILHERIVGYLVETESFSRIKKVHDFDNRVYY